MSRIPDEMLHPSDRFVTRNRLGRWLVLGGYVLTIVLLSLIFIKAALQLLGITGTGTLLALPISLTSSMLLLSRTLPHFFVDVEAFSGMITVDQLRTLLYANTSISATDHASDPKTFPTYGPGRHVAFPWEKRLAEYNVPLRETAIDVVTSVQVSDGKLVYSGSGRIRPDLRNLMPYIGGVASMEGEFTDLISAFIVGDQSGKTVNEALSGLAGLNTRLKNEFSNGTAVTGFEARFGVFVGDMTVAKISPTAEMEKTRSAIDEAKIIADGTAIMLGYTNASELLQAQLAGRINAESVEKARDRFLAVSGNLEGVQVTRYEVAVTGLDPDVMKALTPLIAAYNAAKKPGKK